MPPAPSQRHKLNPLEGTVFDKYDTILIDLDGTIWDCYTPDGDSIGAYQTEYPYTLIDDHEIRDIKGNVVLLQTGVRKVLFLLWSEGKNIGIVSRSEDPNRFFSAQPAVMLLKKFRLWKYFTYEKVIKQQIDKPSYIRAAGRTLYIDDQQQDLTRVDADVLYRNMFKSWDDLLQPLHSNELYSSLSNVSKFAERKADKKGIVRHYNEKGELHRLDGPAIERPDGSKEWWVNDRLHRENGPAVETARGDKFWYRNGLPHREDGPAIEYSDGGKTWYVDGKVHRLEGPAIEWADGTKEWWVNGRPHRLEGPAIIRRDGTKEYWIAGSRHREGGPAVITDTGDKFWFVNNMLHRLDGPAAEWADGTKEWWVNDEYIGSNRSGFTDEKFEQWKKRYGL